MTTRHSIARRAAAATEYAGTVFVIWVGALSLAAAVVSLTP